MSARRRTAFVAMLIAAMVVAGVATSAESSPPTVVATGPRVGSGGGTRAAWYCAEGTSIPNGRADEEVVLGNVARTPSDAVVTVFGGSDLAPVSRSFTVPPGRVVRVRVADILASPEPGVLVEVNGGATAVEHRISRRTDDALGPCAREPSSEAHFASGTSLKGAELWLALFNPFPDDAIVDIRGTTGDGLRAPGGLQGVVVPRFTRVSVPVHDLIPRVDLVAIDATVRRGRAIIEQSLALDGTDGRTGLALSLGGIPARRWFFPAGLIGSGHQERIVLANSSDRDASVKVHFALDAAAAIEPVSMLVPGTSALAVDLGRVPADIGFSVIVDASRPVVAEMIGASSAPQPVAGRGLASDLGFTSGATDWVVVPSHVEAGSVDGLAIVATDRRTHRVQVIRTDGPRSRVVARTVVPKTGRVVVDLSKLLSSPNVALTVRAEGPVAVERESTNPGFSRSHAVLR